MTRSENARLQDCITLCWECRTQCQETLVHQCLPAGGRHVAPEHVKLMLDCIQVCQTAADFMTRASTLHASQCAACADVCEACAESCERIGGKEMLACADACRRCAVSCREMGGMRRAA